MAERCIAPTLLKEGDLVAYLEGEAPPDVVDHITHCPACAAEANDLRQVEALFNQSFSSSEAGAAPSRRRSTFPLRREEIVSRKRAARPLWQPVLALTMLLLLLSLLTLYVLPNDTPPGPDPMVAVTQTAEAVAIAEEAAVPDVDRAVFAKYAQEVPLITAVEATTHRPEPTGLNEFPIIQRRIIDVSVGAQIVMEEHVEIAPPLDLRRRIADESNAYHDLTVNSTRNHVRLRSSTRDRAGNHYRVWVDNDFGRTVLYFSYSADGGQTWSQEIRLDDSVGRAFNPHLTLDDEGTLYLVWQNWLNIDRHAFYFTRSTDGGRTWSGVIRIDENTGIIFNPKLAVTPEGTLSVTWQRQRSINTGIYLTRSTDGGQTWSDEVRAVNIGS